MSKTYSWLVTNPDYQAWVRRTYCDNDYYNFEYLIEYYNLGV